MYQRAKYNWGTVFLFISGSIIEAPKGVTHFAQAGDSKVAKVALTIMEAKEANKAKVAEDNGLSTVSALLGKEGPRDEGNPDQPSVESKEDFLEHLPQHLRLPAMVAKDGTPQFNPFSPPFCHDPSPRLSAATFKADG